MKTTKKELNWLLKEKHDISLVSPKDITVAVRRDIRRLGKGEPLAYVIGWVNFLGCRIDLSQKPLIPRPETEFWTERAIAHIASSMSHMAYRRKQRADGHSRNHKPYAISHKNVRCLDIFAGSGCVGIAVLKHILKVRVDFADKDRRAIAQVKINVKLNKLSARRTKVFRSDIFKNVPGRYDYVFANPPYIATTRKNKVQPAVLKYEPRGALFGGKDGLNLIRKFLKEAKSHLRPGGKIYLEFDHSQRAGVLKIARRNSYRVAVHKDQFSRWRYAILET